MLTYENSLRESGCSVIIGVDEAGRGPLAGPVFAAAVSLKATDFSCRIDDSKKLSPRQRETAFHQIQEKCFCGVGVVNELAIDRLNILQATLIAMEQAVDSLLARAAKAGAQGRVHLLVDGNVPLRGGHPCTAVVDGDRKSLSIACASIVAKVLRDRVMCVYDRVYPGYGFGGHKGYGTAAHYRALAQYGPAPIHRRSFL